MFNQSDFLNEAGPSSARAAGYSFVQDRFGNLAHACFLNGNLESYLSLGTDASLKPRAASIAMWVKIDYIKESGRGIKCTPFILTKNKNGDDFYEAYWMGYGWESQKISANTSLGEARQVSIHSVEPFELSKWTHLVLAYNDDSLRLYVNGTLQNAVPKKFRSEFLENDSIIIGNTANIKNSRYLLGAVDDILIYNRVISAFEVKELFNAPNPNRYAIYSAWALRGLIILLLLGIAVFFIRRKYNEAIRKEQAKNEMSARLNEFETRALRAQMNPHFLFNALATLDGLILEEKINEAHDYLAQFSQLLRGLLESSASEYVSLSDEILILEKYISLEVQRFESGLQFKITNNVKEPGSAYIPFMLLQPFVENAIWHGLSPKKDHRMLSIEFDEKDQNSILCKIEDNGVGRNHANNKKIPFKKRSLAIDFIRQRLEVLSKTTGIDCSVNIIDKKDADNNSLGTLIEVIIPKMKNDTRNNSR